MSDDGHGDDHGHGHDHGEDTDWAAVYDRQVERDHLATQWFDRLELDAGDAVLDVGCGPGHLALLTAELVGPTGIVYAIDRSPGAIRFLVARMGERDVDNIAPIVSDATALGVRFSTPITVLVTFMLHHVENPDAVFRSIDGRVPSGSRVYIAEYDPHGSPDVGPSIDHRIAPSTIRDWNTATEFKLTDEWNDGDRYSMVLEKS